MGKVQSTYDRKKKVPGGEEEGGGEGGEDIIGSRSILGKFPTAINKIRVKVNFKMRSTLCQVLFVYKFGK